MARENIRFILVEPREQGNMGAAARAMKNMGFMHLVLANPASLPGPEAFAFAHGATDVLGAARVCNDFDEAVSGSALVVGTTRRIGNTRGLILPFKEAMARIAAIAAANRVALVFGRENNGLSNEEIEKCGFLATIPTDPAQPSLNLSQAVLLTAYELFLLFEAGDPRGELPPRPRLASQEELGLLYERIRSTLALLKYEVRGSEDLRSAMMRNLRHLIGRYGLTHWELSMLHGICTQIERSLKDTPL